MSRFGQSRRFRPVRATSAIHPIATGKAHVAGCPKKQLRHFEPQFAALFDHLVGAGEQRRRNRQSDRSRGRKIDHQIELGRLFHRNFAGLRAAQIRST